MSDGERKTGKLDGRCLCGAVTVVIDGAHVPEVGVCHCAMCRRWSGGAYMEFGAAADAVAVTGPVATYASSDFAERAFCPTCGSHLWFRNTDAADADYGFAPGIFAQAAAFPLVSEIYVDRAPAYAKFAGMHPRGDRAAYEADKPFVEGDDP